VNRDGVDAVRSGAIGDSGVSSLETSVTGPASVSFYWKVSSETNYDFLRVYVDDVDQGGGISGSVDWVQRTLTIPAGSHTLRWTYSKDVSLAIGSDAGYVDQLVVQSTLPMITVEEPVGMALVDGTASIAFGTINQGSSSAARVFTIRNTGGGDLTGLAVTKSGAHNADFAVNTTGMSASLAPGGSTTPAERGRRRCRSRAMTRRGVRLTSP
jgi:hypothetical protein